MPRPPTQQPPVFRAEKGAPPLNSATGGGRKAPSRRRDACSLGWGGSWYTFGLISGTWMGSLGSSSSSIGAVQEYLAGWVGSRRFFCGDGILSSPPGGLFWIPVFYVVTYSSGEYVPGVFFVRTYVERRCICIKWTFFAHRHFFSSRRASFLGLSAAGHAGGSRLRTPKPQPTSVARVLGDQNREKLQVTTGSVFAELRRAYQGNANPTYFKILLCCSAGGRCCCIMSENRIHCPWHCHYRYGVATEQQ